jgi:hypothetical protein
MIVEHAVLSFVTYYENVFCVGGECDAELCVAASSCLVSYEDENVCFLCSVDIFFGVGSARFRVILLGLDRVVLCPVRGELVACVANPVHHSGDVVLVMESPGDVYLH